MALLSLHWLDRSRFPVAVRVCESGEQIDIPRNDIVSFGRLDIIEGLTANAVVLALPGSLVVLSGVMTLALLGRLHADRPSGDDATLVAG